MTSSHFSKADRVVLGFLSLVLVAGGIFSLYRKNNRPLTPALVISALEVPAGSFAVHAPQAAAKAALGPVDLNQAGAEELEGLPGVGPELAQRILDYRKSKGNFKTVQELLRVPGIGPKKLARLGTRVFVSPPVAPSRPAPSRMKGTAALESGAPESSPVSTSEGVE